MNRPCSWDIFCRIVDNFGDIGVCWRLARQLSAEHGAAVRLWVDDLSRWHALHPAGDPSLDVQIADGVEVRRWTDDDAVVVPADVAMDAFGCGLPVGYAAALAARRPRSLWITLEYLSAEAWVAAHHGLPSPPPALDVERYFYFPGFVAGTGGLIREEGLLERRDRFDDAARRAFWQSAGFDVPPRDAQVISLFAYADAPVRELLQSWESGDFSRIVAVTHGPAADAAADYAGTRVTAGSTFVRGALELRMLPFLEQRRYDELLWASDVNFVRGEDSFVRAQWAARPFVWQAYAQESGAHRSKLAAYLDLYCAGLGPAGSAALRDAWNAWNGLAGNGKPVGEAWPALQRNLPAIERHARRWAAQLAGRPGLARQLAQFCEDRLK